MGFVGRMGIRTNMGICNSGKCLVKSALSGERLRISVQSGKNYSEGQLSKTKVRKSRIVWRLKPTRDKMVIACAHVEVAFILKQY